MEYTVFDNGVSMPKLIQGMLMIVGFENLTKEDIYNIMLTTVNNEITGFDTSHDYGKSEFYMGHAIKRMIKEGSITRDKIFIQSKIGNGQQYYRKIEESVDLSLKTMGLDYLDCMLLHWPLPEVYIENWNKLIQVHKKGKVKVIGLANPQVRHLEAIRKSGAEIMPMVIQTEIHPLYTNNELLEYCHNNNIKVQACSPLCCMIEKIRKNPVLMNLSDRYKTGIANIIMRWHYQRGTTVVFRSYRKKHIEETKHVFEFQLSEEDMKSIDNLNEWYRINPESLNCPGY